MSETEETSSLSVETNHVEMVSVETLNVETENSRVHVETQITDQNTSHVETNADVSVISQVNVETPDTEQVEPNKTQTTCTNLKADSRCIYQRLQSWF